MKFKNKLIKVSIKATDSGIKGLETVIELVDPGAKKVIIEPGLALFLMSDGITVEIYDTGPYYPDYLFAYGNIVFSYQVDDLSETIFRLQQAGSMLLGKVEQLSDSCQYCHMLIKQQIVIGIFANRIKK